MEEYYELKCKVCETINHIDPSTVTIMMGNMIENPINCYSCGSEMFPKYSTPLLVLKKEGGAVTEESPKDYGIDNRACVRVLTFEGKIYRNICKAFEIVISLIMILCSYIKKLGDFIDRFMEWAIHLINWCIVESLLRLGYVIGYPLFLLIFLYDTVIVKGTIFINYILDRIVGDYIMWATPPGINPYTGFAYSEGPTEAAALLAFLCISIFIIGGLAYLGVLVYLSESDHKYAKVIRESMEGKR